MCFWVMRSLEHIHISYSLNSEMLHPEGFYCSPTIIFCWGHGNTPEWELISLISVSWSQHLLETGTASPHPRVLQGNITQADTYREQAMLTMTWGRCAAPHRFRVASTKAGRRPCRTQTHFNMETNLKCSKQCLGACKTVMVFFETYLACISYFCCHCGFAHSVEGCKNENWSFPEKRIVFPKNWNMSFCLGAQILNLPALTNPLARFIK